MPSLFKRARDMEAATRDKYFEMAEKETNPAAAGHRGSPLFSLF